MTATSAGGTRSGGDEEAVRQRVVRVFVSSTFRDMHAEREELAKKVFPQLRRLCESRSVIWSEVDLRWGITDEQKAEGKVLPICLEEIRRCRPFFIGLLGERYGWIPDPVSISEDLVEREPWLSEHRSKSVTELEILHGVLNNPAMSNRALFYFRAKSYIDTLPEDLRGGFLETDAESITKLDALKNRIRLSGLALREDYSAPELLGRLVLRDLTIAINQLFPEHRHLEPLDRDAAEHMFLARSRARVYIGRQEYFDRLNAHAAGEDPPLVVCGESGMGKSALLANWGLRYAENHTDGLFVIHFIGSSPSSSDWVAILRRIMGELKRHFEIASDVPTDAQATCDEFPNWMSMASARGKVVLILDALNQLEDRDAAPDLGWLPDYIPPGVRLIVSTLPGRAQDALVQRGWMAKNRFLTVEPLERSERFVLIREFLKQYTKALSDIRVERIADDPETANPLYLRTLLDEIRLFGAHERLDERIDYYLKTNTIPELYSRILERYEEDYERDRPGLVRDAMTLLWAARRGLGETELLDILGTDDSPLPQALWSPVLLASDQSLVERSGLLTFAHDYLRQAVRNKYLRTESEREDAHLLIADYFELRPLNNRKVDELCWQLHKVSAWARLHQALSILEFLVAAWMFNKYDVYEYWAAIEQHSSLGFDAAFRPALSSLDDLPGNTVWILAEIFGVTGRSSLSLELRDFLVERHRRDGDTANLAYALVVAANEYVTLGRLEEAMHYYTESEQLCRESGDRARLLPALSGQAVVLQRHGNTQNALDMLTQIVNLSRETGDKDSTAFALHSRGLILRELGDLDASLSEIIAAKRICRETGDRISYARCLGAQAILLCDRYDLDGAMALTIEHEAVARQLNHKELLLVALDSRSRIHLVRRQLDEAMKSYREIEQISRNAGHQLALIGALGGQAIVLKEQGKYDEALALHKAEERICKDTGNKSMLRYSLGNQAAVLIHQGKLNEALAICEESEELCRESQYMDSLAFALANKASIKVQLRKFEEAKEAASECERIFQAHDLKAVEQSLRPVLNFVRLKSPNN